MIYEYGLPRTCRQASVRTHKLSSALRAWQAAILLKAADDSIQLKEVDNNGALVR